MIIGLFLSRKGFEPMTQRITDERLAALREAAIACPDWLEVEAEELAGLAADLRDERAKVAECIDLINDFVICEVDYMARNNLGDPEKQHNVKRARSLLAKLSGERR